MQRSGDVIVKPWVRKFAGRWVWRCPARDCRHEAEMPGEEYGDEIRDPWCVALIRAQQHAEQYHGGTVVYEAELRA